MRFALPVVYRHANRDFAVASAVVVALTLAFVAWIWFRIDGVHVSEAVDDVGECAAALIAAFAGAVAAWRNAGRTRMAWALLAASALVWAGGEAAWSYFELVLGQQVPFPSLADAGYLAAVPLAIGGIALFPGRVRVASRVTFVLDGGIMAGALLLISWATVLGSVYRAGSDTPLSAIIGLAYPISDIVIAVLKNIGGASDPLLLWDLLAVVGIVILRQFMVLWDNMTLNQRLQAQSAALQESEGHLRSLVQNSGDAVMLAHADGAVRFVSTSIDRLFAYSPTELIGHPITELPHPDDRAAFTVGLQKSLAASAHSITVS